MAELMKTTVQEIADKPVQFTRYTSTELLSKTWPEPVWIVRDLIPIGLLSLSGRPKVGKSWLALQLGMAVETGGMFIGRHVEQGRLLYLALEDSPRRLADRMKKQGWQASTHGRTPGDFICLRGFLDDFGPLNAPAGRDKLLKIIEQEKYKLVVIDTLSRAIRGDQNDSDKMTAVLSPLQAAAIEQEVGILLIDHHRKMTGTEDDPVQDLSGSGAKAACLDALFGLYRQPGRPDATLKTRAKEVDDQQLTLSWAGALGCWQLVGNTDSLLTSAEQEILDALQAIQPASLKDLSESLNRASSGVLRLLNSLCDKRRIQREGKDKTLVFSLLTVENSIEVCESYEPCEPCESCEPCELRADLPGKPDSRGSHNIVNSHDSHDSHTSKGESVNDDGRIYGTDLIDGGNDDAKD